MVAVTSTLVRSVFAAVLGMFYFGFNTGVVNAPAASIQSFTNQSYYEHYGEYLDKTQQDTIFTIITSAFIVGGMVGAMGGGFVADKIGRKRGLIVSQITGLLGGVIMAISKPTSSWEVLLVGRLVVGLTAGLNTVLVPMYVSEIAPVDLRGGLGVFNQLAVTSGIFLGQILGLSEVLGNDDGWPWLLAVAIIPCVVQLAILVVSPRSPRYLAISLDQEGEARKELMKLRNNDDEMVDRELEEMKEEKEAEQEPEMSILELLSSSKLRQALIICVVMHLSQQFSGMVAIFYYAVNFFESAGISADNAKYANLGVGSIMTAMTLVTIPLMDKLGRRILHLVGLVGMCVMAILIVIAQNLMSKEGDEKSGGSGAFLIAVTLGFVVFFAVGPGSIPWMIAGEMFTQGPRPAASSVVVFVNWAANLAVSNKYAGIYADLLHRDIFRLVWSSLWS
jgi:SP family facilitated glucose transporter-like MFS transporter 1